MSPKGWLYLILAILAGSVTWAALTGVAQMWQNRAAWRVTQGTYPSGMYTVVVPTLMSTPTSTPEGGAAPLATLAPQQNYQAPAAPLATSTVARLPNTGGMLPVCGEPATDPYTGEVIIVTPGIGGRYGCLTPTPVP